MHISDIIKELNIIKNKFGDLPVVTTQFQRPYLIENIYVANDVVAVIDGWSPARLDGLE